MRKILCRALLCLCLVLALGPVHTAFAQDLDRIESYDVDVTPNTEDGSLRIQVTLEWTVLAEGPVSWVKIGVPNGSIRQEQALTDNIDRLSFDNSYMYVYFNRDYDDGETFRFSYSWIQEYMYTLGADGSVEYVYTPGWFNEARVGQMTWTTASSWTLPSGTTAGPLSWPRRAAGTTCPRTTTRGTTRGMTRITRTTAAWVWWGW